MATSSAFLRAARTSSVSSPICLPTFLACLPDFLTCFATPVRPDPVPGIGMPRTFFGLLFSFDPRTTPPMTPAAAVTTPVTTAALDDPFELFEDPDRLPALGRLRELLPREEAADERRLDALALFGLLREVDVLLRELDALLRELDALPRELDALLPFDDVLRVLLPDAVLLGLDPFELREVVFLLLCDRELVWAISPPWFDAPRFFIALPRVLAAKRIGYTAAGSINHYWKRCSGSRNASLARRTGAAPCSCSSWRCCSACAMHPTPTTSRPSPH